MPLTSASKSKKSPTKTKSTTNYLTDYKVVALNVPFYKQTKSGRFTLATALNRREGDTDMARRGDVFTGSLKFTCVHMTTSMDISYRRNKRRDSDKQVPRIAYSVYTKYFDPPTEEEGLKLISI